MSEANLVYGIRLDEAVFSPIDGVIFDLKKVDWLDQEQYDLLRTAYDYSWGGEMNLDTLQADPDVDYEYEVEKLDKLLKHLSDNKLTFYVLGYDECLFLVYSPLTVRTEDISPVEFDHENGPKAAEQAFQNFFTAMEWDFSQFDSKKLRPEWVLGVYVED